MSDPARAASAFGRGSPTHGTSWLVPILLAAGAIVAFSLAWEGRARLEDGAARAGVDGFPRTVPLPDGQSISLDAPPLRVVPAAAGSVDVVCALLPPGRVAGLPGQALTYSGLRDADSPYLARPTFHHYEAEAILALRPDLVVAHTWQRPETTSRLREHAVPVVSLPDPNSWPEAREQLLLMGRVFGAEDRAAALVDAYNTRVAALLARREEGRRPTALCYSNGGAGGWVAGDRTTNDEMLYLAGLENLAARDGRTGHTQIDFEGLLDLDPEVFVVSGPAEGLSAGGTAHLLRTEPALAPLAAVREGRIVEIEPWLYTTLSQHLVDAAEEVARRVEALGLGPEPR